MGVNGDLAHFTVSLRGDGQVMTWLLLDAHGRCCEGGSCLRRPYAGHETQRTCNDGCSVEVAVAHPLTQFWDRVRVRSVHRSRRVPGRVRAGHPEVRHAVFKTVARPASWSRVGSTPMHLRHPKLNCKISTPVLILQFCSERLRTPELGRFSGSAANLLPNAPEHC